jgi:hypothetical protein
MNGIESGWKWTEAMTAVNCPPDGVHGRSSRTRRQDGLHALWKSTRCMASDAQQVVQSVLYGGDAGAFSRFIRCWRSGYAKCLDLKFRRCVTGVAEFSQGGQPRRPDFKPVPITGRLRR